jgi:hypothetical protein
MKIIEALIRINNHIEDVKGLGQKLHESHRIHVTKEIHGMLGAIEEIFDGLAKEIKKQIEIEEIKEPTCTE